LTHLRQFFDAPYVRKWLRWTFFAAAAFALVMALLPKPPHIPGEPGDKIQHMIAFATLGAIAAAGWRDRAILIPFAALAAFGASIEILQMIPSLHRDAEFLDWIADVAAAIGGIAIVRLFLPRL
jgi:VanZ family protein